MNLTQQDIIENLSLREFNKGYAYYKSNKATIDEIIHESSDELTIIGTTRGSGRNIYHQTIDISDTAGGILIEGDCSCPVDYNCKHVAAVTIKYLLQSDKHVVKVREGAVDDWLDAIELSDIQPSSQDNQLLLYQLSIVETWNVLRVDFFKTRVLKNGNLGTEYRMSFEQLSNSYHSPAYLNLEDKKIIKYLEASNERWGTSIYIQDELGSACLRALAKSGKAFLGNQREIPISFDEPRNLLFEWQKNSSNAVYSLQPVITPSSAEIVMTEPVHYIDTIKNSAGVLNTGHLNITKLKKLLKAPFLGEEELAGTIAKMTTIMPELDLKLPKTFQMTEIENTQPVAKVKLVALANQDGTFFHQIEMSFFYKEHLIDPIPVQPFKVISGKNSAVKITRDLETEKSLVERITDLGFSVQLSYDSLILRSIAEPDMNSALKRWDLFLKNTVEELRDEGWIIEFDENFSMNFLAADEIESEVVSHNDWFDLSFDLTIGGRKLPLLPILTSAFANFDFDQKLPDTFYIDIGEDQFASVKSETLLPVVNVIKELHTYKDTSGESLRIGRFETHLIDESSGIKFINAAPLFKLSNKLKNFDGIEKVEPPKGLKAKLRGYQQDGFEWLQFLREYGFGGILADDMGLGKTVQALTHILYEKEQNRLQDPVLVIAPTSLMGNWKREAAKFTPDLKVLILQGMERKIHFDSLAEYDIILTTYPLLNRDSETLLSQEYTALILDEAQFIKNSKAKASRMVRTLKAKWRLCLSGTPMENHLGELWGLFDFLMPEFLFSEKGFKEHFRNPIEKEGDIQRQALLSNRVKPFLLRRTKDLVASELPKKTEILRTVPFEKKQAMLYESIRVTMEKKVRDLIKKQGLDKSHITILDALLKLRQVCCDPSLLKLSEAKNVKESAKLTMLLMLVEELLEEGRKIILFSQFTSMLSIIENELNKRKISYSKLTGQTRKRDEAIEHFTSGKSQIFLISLKAGGVGLNLTEADTVIHYDPWWNPAVENQATDRAHRIGQDKPVFVYKLIIENSIEEKILKLQEKKKALSDAVFEKKEKGSAGFNKESLLSLFE